MQRITLLRIEKNKNQINYVFEKTEGLDKYFSGKDFFIEYPVDVESVPNSMLAIPFVCNVLPIMWLTNCELIVSELDLSFYNCIPNLKKGYEKMFPSVRFEGVLEAKKLVENVYEESNNCAMFYSGGLDSVQTFISHKEENPHLISIWGSDIKCDNKDGWDVLHKNISETAKKYGLKDIVIRSSFREFDNEGILHTEFYNILDDGWWHGVKHGIGLLGHVAPYAWLNKISTMYIASTYWDNGTIIKCASSPYTDNEVRFCGCKVVHDGFEYNRQDKVSNLIKYAKRTGDIIELHVCWKTQTGSNCCKCEKCYRTMSSFWAEGEDPTIYGFSKANETLKDMKKIIFTPPIDFLSVSTYGPMIQKRARENKNIIKAKPYYKDFKWVLTKNFKKLPNNNALWRRALRKIKRIIFKKK